MGNCFKRHKNSTPDGISTPSESPTDATDVRKKKVVRFDLRDDADADNASGEKAKNVVRLRIVVSTQELNQILNMEKDQMCLDRLLDAVRVSGGKITQVEDGSSNDVKDAGGLIWGASRRNDVERRWKPNLESIPEKY